MNSNTKIYTAIAAVLLVAQSAEAGPKWNAAQEPWDQVERRKAAELRAELMAPVMTRAETEKVAAVLAARKQQAQREFAGYQQFKIDQQMALAEASAPRSYTVINNYMGNPEKRQPSATAYTNTSGGMRRIGYSQPATPESADRDFLAAESRQRRQKTYPPNYYWRAAQEESADKLAAALATQSQRDAMTPPFGQPVPGMPGYVTGPAPMIKGYIDVRGLTPGTEVQDPYTGSWMRVP